MNWLEKLGYGGIAMVIGLIIVFFGLTIIIACLYLMAAIFKKINKRKAEKEAAVVSAVTQPEPEIIENATEVIQEQDDSELVAVIAAAIAAFTSGENGKSLPVKIKSIKRISGWNSAARTEQIYKF